LGIRLSLRPLFSEGQGFVIRSGASRREMAQLCLMNTNTRYTFSLRECAPHSQSSLPAYAYAGDPVFQRRR
jgi:hypothetical protein